MLLTLKQVNLPALGQHLKKSPVPSLGAALPSGLTPRRAKDSIVASLPSHDAIMPRPFFIAPLLLLLVASMSGVAQDRTAPPGNAPLPATGDDRGLPASTVTSTAGTGFSNSDDCGEALRRETAQHQQQAAATNSLPAPLVLPPECGGAPSPSPAAK